MNWFKEDDRAVIRALADILIPDAEGMPSASAAGAADELLDRVVQLRADLAPRVLAAVRFARGKDHRAALEELRTHDSETWQGFCLAIAGGYYLFDDVRALLGYTGPERRPVDPEAAPDFTDLLAPVLARGPIWRAPRTTGEAP
ncbi:hypothetical protein OLX02_18850 [Novosphingobium sp. KCTC 2891]|uniref:hypothetical protein n=1 Tax=Novosphingobium sp. KCTC 2891 TaxID=2989730 RepID=UPI0022229B25|nr:hypothetical protein [Novosphingobium sp. KCTC 2891]MCW1384878.1 hypothetical protein [Novosphingobium sp. KCTC 2891]